MGSGRKTKTEWYMVDRMPGEIPDVCGKPRNFNRLPSNTWASRAIQVEDPRPAKDSLPREIAQLGESLRELKGPPQPCVYFLIAESAVVYVGQSVNLSARVLSHIKGKHFDRVVYLPTSKAELGAVELKFIRALRPKYNARVKAGE
jgi:hypothetical protein